MQISQVVWVLISSSLLFMANGLSPLWGVLAVGAVYGAAKVEDAYHQHKMEQEMQELFASFADERFVEINEDQQPIRVVEQPQ